MDLLGFMVVPRPPFEAEGFWLYGHGLNLHIVASRFPRQRRQSLRTKVAQIKSAMPRCDHVAFTSRDLDTVKETLENLAIFFVEDFPVAGATSFRQLFFLDPDGNVIEISNCGPPVGKISCE